MRVLTDADRSDEGQAVLSRAGAAHIHLRPTRRRCGGGVVRRLVDPLKIVALTPLTLMLQRRLVVWQDKRWYQLLMGCCACAATPVVATGEPGVSIVCAVHSD
jgi:hypothetical protein